VVELYKSSVGFTGISGWGECRQLRTQETIASEKRAGGGKIPALRLSEMGMPAAHAKSMR
jgi:hypothetical protein